jgi:hypothetical protein
MSTFILSAEGDVGTGGPAPGRRCKCVTRRANLRPTHRNARHLLSTWLQLTVSSGTGTTFLPNEASLVPRSPTLEP